MVDGDGDTPMSDSNKRPREDAGGGAEDEQESKRLRTGRDAEDTSEIQPVPGSTSDTKENITLAASANATMWSWEKGIGGSWTTGVEKVMNWTNAKWMPIFQSSMLSAPAASGSSGVVSGVPSAISPLVASGSSGVVSGVPSATPPPAVTENAGTALEAAPQGGGQAPTENIPEINTWYGVIIVNVLACLTYVCDMMARTVGALIHCTTGRSILQLLLEGILKIWMKILLACIATFVAMLQYVLRLPSYGDLVVDLYLLFFVFCALGAFFWLLHYIHQNPTDAKSKVAKHVLTLLVLLVFVGAMYFHWQWKSSGTCWVETSFKVRERNRIKEKPTYTTVTKKDMHTSNISIAWRPILGMFVCIVLVLTQKQPFYGLGVCLGCVFLYYMSCQRSYVDAFAKQSQHLCNAIIVAVRNMSTSS